MKQGPSRADLPPFIYESQCDRERAERVRSDKRNLAGFIFGSVVAVSIFVRCTPNLTKFISDIGKPKSPEERALIRKHILQDWMKENKELVAFVHNSEQLKVDVKDLESKFGDEFLPKVSAASMWKVSLSLLSCKASLRWVKENDPTFKKYPEKSDLLIKDIDSMMLTIIKQSGGRRSQLNFISLQGTPTMCSEDYFHSFTKSFGSKLPSPQQLIEFQSSEKIDFSMLESIAYRVEKSAGVATEKRYEEILREQEESAKH